MKSTPFGLPFVSFPTNQIAKVQDLIFEMAFKFDLKKKMVVCLNNLEQTSRTYSLLGFVKESSLSDSSIQKELELLALVLLVET